MSHQSELISKDIEAYLAQHEQKDLLRLLTCGSVDDGKSTLIGRLLHDSKLIYEDQLAAVQADSVKSGTTGGKIDLALLVDGLQAEREQGITIDVAYRYFSTANRKFIIADTPGHEQYTRNMATGASTCDLAIILIDARYGVQIQTKRHSFIASLLGIQHIVVAINKMDLVNYSESVFTSIKKDYLTFSQKLDHLGIHFIPLSALEGDNVVKSSEQMPWYQGKPLMEILTTIEINDYRNFSNMRFPVQYVNRPNLDFRGYCGTVASGILKKGDEIMALPSRKTSRIEAIVTQDGELEEAFPPMSVTITLEDEIDISRGDMIAHSNDLPEVDNRFEAHIVWMAEQPLAAGKQFYIKHATRTVTGSISALHHRIDINTLEQHSVDQLNLNEIGLCEVALNAPIAFDSYRLSQRTGAFIIIDRLTHGTVGAGMIVSSTIRDTEKRQVTPDERAARFGQKPATLLISGDNQQQFAQTLERKLFDTGHVCTMLNDPELGKEAHKTARLINQAGIICLCTLDSSILEADSNVIKISSESMKADEVIAMLKEQKILQEG